MIDGRIDGAEEAMDLDVPLRRFDDLPFEEQARIRRRIDEFIRSGFIKPNAFDPMNRKLRWPDPIPETFDKD
jgi:hypothetical protein